MDVRWLACTCQVAGPVERPFVGTAAARRQRQLEQREPSRRQAAIQEEEASCEYLHELGSTGTGAKRPRPTKRTPAPARLFRMNRRYRRYYFRDRTALRALGRKGSRRPVISAELVQARPAEWGGSFPAGPGSCCVSERPATWAVPPRPRIVASDTHHAQELRPCGVSGAHLLPQAWKRRTMRERPCRRSCHHGVFRILCVFFLRFFCKPSP